MTPELLPAWTAHRWTACAASARRPRGGWPTKPLSDLAKECKAIEAAARALVRVEVTAAEELLDRVAPGGWVMTAELVHQAQTFASVVIEYGRQRGIFYDVQDASCLHQWGGVGGISGYFAVDAAGMAHVFRLDYGYQLVELDGNVGDLQLALLAIAVFEHPDLSRLAGASLGVEMHVYQPRPYHREGPWRRRHRTDVELNNMRNWLGHCAARATSPNALALTNEHCGGCAHLADCDVARKQAYLDLQLMHDELFGDRPTPEGLALQLRHAELHAELADARLKVLKREASARAAAGEWIPGWGRREGFADRVLRDPAAAELATGVRAYKTVLRTPAEMERDGADPDVLANFTHRPSTGPRLVKLTAADAKRSFKT